jgi:hypothetical protein
MVVGRDTTTVEQGLAVTVAAAGVQATTVGMIAVVRIVGAGARIGARGSLTEGTNTTAAAAVVVVMRKMRGGIQGMS